MKNRKNYLKARKKRFKWDMVGWHSDIPCAKCGQKTKYHIYKYDAWCCTSCNEWLEKPCGDPNCPMCGKRPETPLEVFFITDTETGSAGRRKLWRCENYQHKTDGMRKHKRRREEILQYAVFPKRKLRSNRK